MTRTLFIGGPADGQWLHTEDNHTHWRVPGKVSHRQVHEYYRERFVADNEVWSIFIHSSLTVADAMRMLIEGYKQEPTP